MKSASWIPTVISVDDDREMLRTVQRVLRTEKIHLISYGDPRRVLEHLEEEPVDLVLSDIDMPQMSGLDLLRRVRAICPSAARVILSGVSSMDAAITAINEGAVHRYVRKPFDPAHLRRALGEALAQVQMDREADSARRLVAARDLWRHRAQAVSPNLVAVHRDNTGAYILDIPSIDETAPRLGLEHLLRVYDA